MFDEPTFACRDCLDRGWLLQECHSEPRTRFNGGLPFTVVSSCRICHRGVSHAAGYWRGPMETESGMRRFFAWAEKEPEFAAKVRTVIDAGEPKSI